MPASGQTRQSSDRANFSASASSGHADRRARGVEIGHRDAVQASKAGGPGSCATKSRTTNGQASDRCCRTRRAASGDAPRQARGTPGQQGTREGERFSPDRSGAGGAAEAPAGDHPGGNSWAPDAARCIGSSPRRRCCRCRDRRRRPDRGRAAACDRPRHW